MMDKAIIKVERDSLLRSLSPQPGSPPPPLSGWQRARSEQGRTYFWNVETGERSWELPRHAQVAGDTEVIDSRPLGGWRAIMDTRKHKPYFWHIDTGDVVWRMPVAYAEAMAEVKTVQLCTCYR